MNPRTQPKPAQAPSSLGHMPEGRWQFDESVATVFDDMLRRSIPQHEVMRRAVFDVACRFVQDDTDIIDLGCSRGEAVAPLIAQYGTRNRYVGIDISKPMLEASRRRFEEVIRAGLVQISEMDLRRGYPIVRASVTLSVLTIQFIPIESRPRIVRDVWKHTTQGGAFVMVEKILGATSDLDTLMVDRYHQLKREAGYSQEEIDRKRYALRGVLVPMTARWNEELLAQAGFAQIDCFWRWMNFAGWVAVKG